jgi:signal transduction histidine kinase
MHGGEISVGSAPESGALLTVSIPLHAPSGVEVRRAATEAAGAGLAETFVAELRRDAGPVASLGPRDRPLVLVVEDHPDMNRFVCESLSGEFRTAAALSGDTGLRRAIALQPDLIVSDVMMPGMGGERLVKEIRTRPELAHVPIVLLTAKADDELRTRLLREGAQDYLMKPFSAGELVARVKNLVTLKRVGDVLRKEATARSEDLAALAEELAHSQQRVETQNEDLETMLHVAAHDLQEPLGTIALFASTVNEKYAAGLDERANDLLRRIGRGAERMRRLLDDLVEISRARQIVPAAAEIPSASVVEETLDRLADRIRDTTATVRVATALPAIRAQRAWAIIALSNVVSNALKFTQPGVAPDVEIGPYEGPEGTGFVVADRGPGVPAEMAERIFQLFQRGVLRSVEGTGAGLAIVRQIVDRHGGAAWVRARRGGGSEFVVTFGAGAGRGASQARQKVSGATGK